MEENILHIFIARGAEAQSSEMLPILSWCSLPSFLSTQHGEGTGKPFPGLDQCRISEAEMGCTEHSQESHRGALEGTQMPAVVRDKALPVGTHRNSAQGSKYEAFSALEHPGESVTQEEHVLFLLCMLDNLGAALRTQLPGS